MERFNPSGRYYTEDLRIKVRYYNPKEIDWLTYNSHFEAVGTQSSWSVSTKCARLMVALQCSLTVVVAGLLTRYNHLVLGSQVGHSPWYIKYTKRL